MLNTKTSSIVVIALLLFARNSDMNNKNNQTETEFHENEVPQLADSLIPQTVKVIIELLEQNGTKTLIISNSKWNLFGEQGIWLKTENGILDIIPFTPNIDVSMIKIEEIKSESANYTYELKYNDTLQQTIQGKETFFVLGKRQVYKSLDKSLIKEIKKVETQKK